MELTSESSWSSNKPWTWEQCEFQIGGLGMFSPPILIEIRDRCSKTIPRRKVGRSTFRLPFLLLIILLPLCRCGPVSFAVKHSSGTELLKLG